MKRQICRILTLLLVSLSSFANSEITIKEINELVGVQIQKSDTCLDEYLQRRKELSTKLFLTPLTGAAEIGGGTFGGLGVGMIIANTMISEGWAQLGALIGGGLIGFAGGTVVFISGTTTNIVKFANNDRIIKWIAEARLTAGGRATNKMLKKYNKKFKKDHSTEEDLAAALVDLDRSGALCNGSIVAPSRFKKGKKLKQRLANKGEIFKKIHEVISQ